MTHDPLCSNASGSCCPWMGDCNCRCLCDFIAEVRADERAKYVPPDLPRGGEHVDYCRDLACCGCEEITDGVIAQML